MSEESKKHSAKLIKSLGGDAATHGKQEDPRSKRAAEKLESDRVD